MEKIRYISVLALAAAISSGCHGSTGKTAQVDSDSLSDTSMTSGVDDMQVSGLSDSSITNDSDSNLESISEASSSQGGTANNSDSSSSSKGKIDGKQRLLNAYPDKIKEIKNNTIYFTDGTTMIYDDGKEKDFVYMLDNSDPEDMFFYEYDTSATTPEYLHDVGRSRSEQLFKKLYGSSSSAVSKQLVSVPWFGGNVKFSSSNNAAKQLEKVYKELSQHPELKKYLKSSGTFYWRNVRGANRLSAHSYGIAIDIGVDYSDYWLWKNPGAPETKKITYKNRIPMQIVEIFEKYGFVWGGRWYHYDTMHFEYRPELNPPQK